MDFLSGLFLRFFVVLLCLGLSGCFPFPVTDEDEKNPLIGDGLAKKAAYNYQGAVESFEKALEGNPRLARAHWELALLYSQNVPNPAAAIYHFEKLLKLRPDWPQAETARRFIDAAKIELAKSVPLGPQTPYMQQQLDKLTAQVHEMANENNRLREQNQALSLQIHQLTIENTQLKDKLRAFQFQSNAVLSTAGRGTETNVARYTQGSGQETQHRTTGFAQGTSKIPKSSIPDQGTTNSMTRPRASTTSTTYTVRAGDTLSAIAAAHGVKLSDLIRANPQINPDRIRVGQIINIP